jgi:hypothetical protein
MTKRLNLGHDCPPAYASSSSLPYEEVNRTNTPTYRPVAGDSYTLAGQVSPNAPPYAGTDALHHEHMLQSPTGKKSAVPHNISRQDVSSLPYAGIPSPDERSLQNYTLHALKALLRADPSSTGIIYHEATKRWDSLRLKPRNRHTDTDLKQPDALLKAIQTYQLQLARHGQEDIVRLYAAVALGQPLRSGLQSIFNRVLGEANAMVKARIQSAMELILPATIATRHGIPLLAVAEYFEQENLGAALNFLYLVLDIWATMPLGEAPSSPLPMAPGTQTDNLTRSIAWAYAHRAEMVRQVNQLGSAALPLLQSPCGFLVRLAVGLDHVDALAALANLPDANELYGHNHAYVALGLAMDAGSTRCARWLIDRGNRMDDHALDAQLKQVHAAHDHMAQEKPGHEPLDYVSYMHRQRLEVARICADTE